MGLAVCMLALTSATIGAERLPVRLYTSADGLPSQFVERVFRDSQGLMWFATREGLSRFDGARFVNYGIRDGLPHLGINDIIEPRPGTYWIATNGAGVVRFDSVSTVRQRPATGDQPSNRFVTHATGTTARGAHVNVLYQDPAGRIWAGSDAGLFVWRESTQSFERVLLNWPAREEEIAIHKALLDDGEGGLWVGTNFGLVRWMADGRAVWYRSPFAGAPSPDTVLPEAEGAVRAVLRDPSGRLWIGTHDGVLVYVPETMGRVTSRDRPWRAAACAGSVDPSGRLVSMTLPTAPGTVCRFRLGAHTTANWISALLFQSTQGFMWIGSLDGLSQVSPDGRVRSFGVTHGVPDPNIGSLAEDRDNNLWIATPSGAARLASDGLITYTEADGLGAPQVYWIGEDPRGILHVVSGAWLISRLEEPRFVTQRLAVPPDPLPTWGTQAAMLDRRGHWWAATRRGLFQFAPVPGVRSPTRIFRPPDGLPAEDAFATFEDSAGGLWISTISAGTGNLARLDRQTHRIRVFSHHDGLSTTTTAKAFVEDASGAIWIGFQYGGIARYAHGRFRMFAREDGLPPGQISALHIDRAGRLWIGSTVGGLGRVDNPRDDELRFRVYTVADGLLSDNVRCLVDDQQGRVYVGTGKGITRLEPETGQVRQFTTAHGLANDFLTAAFRDRRGTLWFGTLRGLSRLDPSPERPLLPPVVAFAAIRVAGVPIALPELGLSTHDELTLGPAENDVQFEFFGIGESLRYRYRLLGVDERWNGPTDQRTITYATLAPGAYRFEVEAVTPNGMVSERPATVSFALQAPLWRRGWFIVVVVIAFTALVHAGYRLRLRRALALERVRTRIATDLHDDIGSSLSQIAILSDLARQQAGGVSDAAPTLSSIAATARESVDAMSDIVWALNPNRDSFQDLTQRMRGAANDLLSARNISLQFSTDGTAPSIQFDAATRREILLALKETLNNVVRHSHAERVAIDLRQRVGCLVLTVADDGCGFDPKAPATGLGLASLRQRSAKLRGTLAIDSSRGHGTTVRLEVPLPGRQSYWRR